MARLLVLGDVMLDASVHGVITRTSPEDPNTPLAQATDWYYNLGGAGNTAEILTLAGHEVTLMGAIAHDWAGGVVEALCGLLGIRSKLRHVLSVTSTKIRIYDGERYILRSDVERFVEVPPWQWKANSYDAVILSDYRRGMLHEGCAEHIQAIHGVVVVDCKPSDWAGIYHGTTALLPNEKESMQFADLYGLGWSNREDLAMRLRRHFGAGCFVMTCGADGVVVATEDGQSGHITAPRVDNPHVLGAGDAVTAHMAVALAEGLGYWEAAEAACAAANEYVSREREAVRGSLLGLD